MTAASSSHNPARSTGWRNRWTGSASAASDSMRSGVVITCASISQNFSQAPHGSMRGDLESCDRDPARGRRLLERHLLELQQCYRLTLGFRQPVDRLSQSAVIARDFRKVRVASGKGFMLGHE